MATSSQADAAGHPARLRHVLPPDTCCVRQVYHEQADGVERYYREAGLLMDFEIVTGLKETMPALTAALQPYTQQQEQLEQLREAPY